MTAEKARITWGNPIMHRLQIGLAGIFSVLMLVALADMLLDGAGGDGAGADMATTAFGVAEPDTTDLVKPPVASEPLVDLGVVPDLPAEGSQPNLGGQTPLVGELQPDPQSGTKPPQKP